MTALVVFISGPYTADTDEGIRQNVRRACAAGKALLDRGHWPFVPHLTIGFDRWHKSTYGFPLEPEAYYAWDLAILRRCDGLLFLGSSPGADRELAFAKELGMPVWLAVEDVPVVAS